MVKTAVAGTRIMKPAPHISSCASFHSRKKKNRCDFWSYATTQALNHKSSQETPHPPVHSPCPLSRFHGRDRCQLSGWWLRTGHPVSHFALLAIYVVKSSMAPVEHLTNAFLDWLQNSGHSLWLQFKPSKCKFKKNILTRLEVMGRLEWPSKITFSLAVIMALSKAAFMSSQTNYSAGNTYTQTAAITQSVLPWKN